jgi:TIR domain/Sel1 repeat
MAGKIFINYRRGDEPGFAQALLGRLEANFPAERLFIDVDNIPPGEDFVQVLQSQVAQCDVLLAMIGKSWLDAKDDRGARRLDDPNDFVRIEIESALQHGKRVIPVLVHDAQMPRADELPEAIRPLATRNAVRLTHERFRADVQGLVRALEKALDESDLPRLGRERDDALQQGREAKEEAKTPDLRKQLEHVSSEQPTTVAVRSTVPWRIIAGSAIILGVIVIVVAVWRPGSPVTPEDVSAMKDQGDRYYFGVNASKDSAKAREWYEKAADKGSVDAMVSLGVLYADGQGVAQDYAKAREWYQKAVGKGSADAMYKLGNLYDDGHGVAQDFAKAREWYQKAADKGSVEAMFTLGLHYDYGHGVAQDTAKAREWYEKAAEKGDASAKLRLQQLPTR